MGLRLRSVRQKILFLVLVPVLSLIALYIFATVLTARNAISLSRTDTLKSALALPVGNFVTAMKAERVLALTYLSRPTGSNLAALEVAESKSGNVAAEVRSSLRSGSMVASSSASTKRAIATLLQDVSGLPAVRSQIRAQIITRDVAFSDYNKAVDDSLAMLKRLVLQQASVPVTTQSLTVLNVGAAEEFMAREEALLLSDVAAGNFPAADRQQFTELVGARRTLYASSLADLQPSYRAYFARYVPAAASAQLAAMEGTLAGDTITSRPPAVSPAAWQQAFRAVTEGITRATGPVSNQLAQQASGQARSTLLVLILAGGLGLLAVAVSIIVSIRVGRGMVRELAVLRDSALELASKRLPSVVQRLADGQPVDVAAEAPELPASSDEIGQVQQAFAAVQQTAVEAAVGQAKLRQGISDLFRNLARRSQSLLHRQLTLLDAMERRAKEPEELEDLFRIDHLTTRMRRHAESLIILSGEAPARSWRRPVPFVDVLRAAVAEVEDYTRIKVTATTKAAIKGPAVADVIHLIAELAENAVIFSPPNTPVLITGDVVGRGFAVEIEDRGLGLSEQRRAELNQLLEDPPPFDASGSDRLGLFVASQLARKHDIKLSLRSSPYGGTTAIILIPLSLVVPEDGYEADATGDGAQGVLLTGRHAAREEPPTASTPAPASPPAADARPAGTAAVATSPPEWPGSPGSEAATAALRGQNGFPAPAAQDSPLWPVADGQPAGEAGADSTVACRLGNGSAAGSRAASGTRNGGAAGPSTPYPSAGDSSAGHGSAGNGSGANGGARDEVASLPRRIRQASLAPQLRAGAEYTRVPPATDLAAAADALHERSPEETRSTVSSLQRGWERGRSLFDAAPKTPAPASPDPATGEAEAASPDSGPATSDRDD